MQPVQVQGDPDGGRGGKEGISSCCPGRGWVSAMSGAAFKEAEQQGERYRAKKVS